MRRSLARHAGSSARVICEGQWKFIPDGDANAGKAGRTRPDELHNRAEGPAEQRTVCEQRPEIEKRLAKRLEN